MKTVNLSELFDIKYGNSFELINLVECDQERPECVNFISRTEKDNGISAYVERLTEVEPNKAGTITVAVSGSVLSTFFQTCPYYTGFHVMILSPKRSMSDEEMLFYAYAINKNKYRYNYGRQANKTLKNILLPAVMPKEWQDFSIKKIKKLGSKSIDKNSVLINTENWRWYRYDEIFNIRKGFYNRKPEVKENGEIKFIGATEYNNGITSRHTLEQVEEASKDGGAKNQAISQKIFVKNCITVSNNGSVGNAFYQPRDFICSHDVNPLYLKNAEMNVYIAMFLSVVIGKEKYRWNYGRKWRPSRMPDSVIKLPSQNEKPDWYFMEKYIKSLPYSESL